MIKQYASLRFDASNGPSEIDAIARAIVSDGWVVAPLNIAAGRAYTALELGPHADLPLLRAMLRAFAPSALLDVPARVVLNVETESETDAQSVRDALGGAGGLEGAVTHSAGERSTIVEIDETKARLALVLDAIDTELRGRGRRIVPVIPIDDDVLARFAGAVIAEPDLDGSRVIETYLPDDQER